MNDTPLYPKLGITLPCRNTPPIFIVAGLGLVLERGGVPREEINRIFNDLLSVEPENLAAACAKYVHMR